MSLQEARENLAVAKYANINAELDYREAERSLRDKHEAWLRAQHIVRNAKDELKSYEDNRAARKLRIANMPGRKDV